MSIRVDCGCGKTFWVQDSDAGKTIACPHCSKNVAVPAMTQDMWFDRIPVDAAELIASLLRGMALASLVFAILSFLCFVLAYKFGELAFVIFPVVSTGLFAIVTGAVALNVIRKSPRLRGRGMALAGIVLGVLAIGGYFLNLCGFL